MLHVEEEEKEEAIFTYFLAIFSTIFNSGWTVGRRSGRWRTQQHSENLFASHGVPCYLLGRIAKLKKS